MKAKAMIRYEKGTDQDRCTSLLEEHASVLMSAADANMERARTHKAYLSLMEEGMILCCAGRRQAEAEGMVFDNDASYLLIAYSWDGEIGKYIRKHCENDPDAIHVPYPTKRKSKSKPGKKSKGG